MSDRNLLEDGLGRVARAKWGTASNVCRLERLSGGASQELWSFDVEGDGSARNLILRRNPNGSVERTISAGLEAEAHVMQIVAAAGGPVPKVEYVFAPSDGLGIGFIMQRIEGETLPKRIIRDERYAVARARLAGQLGSAAARIHALGACASSLRHSRIVDRIDQLSDLYQAHGSVRPVMEWAFRWLRDNMPSEPGEPGLVHGDLRNGNIIVGPEGLRAVLDWEAVHLGDPMEDLGWMCVASWRFGEINMPVAGVGSRAELFAGYESFSGTPVDPARVLFWEVFGTLRWGVTCGIFLQEFRQGDRSIEKAAIGRRASETELDLLSILAPRKGDVHA